MATLRDGRKSAVAATVGACSAAMASLPAQVLTESIYHWWSNCLPPIRSSTVTKCCTPEYRCAISRDTEVPAKLDVLEEYDLWCIDRNFNRPHALKEVTLALSVFRMSVIFRRVISQSIKRPAFLFMYISWNSLLQSWRYVTSWRVAAMTGMTFPFLFEDASWYTYLPF